MDFKIDTFNLPYAFEIRADVCVQSDTLFSVMQMTTEGNKYIIRRLKFEGPFVTDCLGVHVDPYDLASGGEKTMEARTIYILFIRRKLLGDFLFNDFLHL